MSWFGCSQLKWRSLEWLIRIFYENIKTLSKILKVPTELFFWGNSINFRIYYWENDMNYDQSKSYMIV